MYRFPMKRFATKQLRVGAFQNALSTALLEVIRDVDKVDILLTKTFADGTEHSTSVKLAGTEQVCYLGSTNLSIAFREENGSRVHLGLTSDDGELRFFPRGDDANASPQFADRLAEILELQPLGERRVRITRIGCYSLPPRCFHSRRFTAGKIRQAFDAILLELGAVPDDAEVRLDEILFNGVGHERSIELDDVDELCELEGKEVSLRCRDSGDSSLSVSLSGKLGGLLMLAYGEDLGRTQQLADRLAQLLELSEAPQQPSEGEAVRLRVEV